MPRPRPSDMARFGIDQKVEYVLSSNLPEPWMGLTLNTWEKFLGRNPEFHLCLLCNPGTISEAVFRIPATVISNQVLPRAGWHALKDKPAGQAKLYVKLLGGNILRFYSDTYKDGVSLDATAYRLAEAPVGPGPASSHHHVQAALQAMASLIENLESAMALLVEEAQHALEKKDFTTASELAQHAAYFETVKGTLLHLHQNWPETR